MPYKLVGGGLRTAFGKNDRVSPEQVIESAGWSAGRGGGGRTYQSFLLLVTCVTIASEAAEVALLSLVLPHIRAEFNLNGFETDQVAVSIFAGQMAGCFVLGKLADVRGRRPCAILASFLVAAGGYLSAMAWDVNTLMACRFVVGMGVGAAFVPIDMLAEACPDDVRTAVTQVANLSFSVGVVAITILGWLTLDARGWRTLTFLTAVPPTFACVMSCYLEESPTWSAERGKTADAKRVLDRICAENTGRFLPEGLEIISERELKKNDGMTRPATANSANSANSATTADDALLGLSLLGGELGGSTGAGESSDSPPDAETNVKLATSVAHNLVGTRVNAFRTLCLWTVAFVQTFNFYGLMLHSPLVFRRTAYDDLGRERKDVIAFDFLAIIIVNAGDIVGNGLALAALKAKANPRWVCAACACVCVPLLWVPLIDALRSSRTGLIFMMLIGRIPAAPIGAMSWILASVAYPTLFRATGHGLANAVARFGAVAASSMYSTRASIGVPIHAIALAAIVPAALRLPLGSLESAVGGGGVGGGSVGMTSVRRKNAS